MTNPRVLVAYYSRTGNTRGVAREIAAQMPCEVEEIADDRDRRGLVAYVRAAYEAWMGRPVPLRAPRFDPGDFDLVVVATPIWNLSVASPVCSYLKRHRGAWPEVAFVVTCGGMGIDSVKRQLTELTSRSPVAFLAVRERELAATRKLVEPFVAGLRRSRSRPVLLRETR